MTLATIIKYLVKPEYQQITYYTTIIAFSIILYFFINISHYTFLKQQKIWKTIKETLKTLFQKPKTYIGIIAGSAASILIFYIIYLITLLTAKITIFTTQQAYTKNLPKYDLSIKILAAAFIYTLIFTNRACFKFIVDKASQQKIRFK